VDTPQTLNNEIIGVLLSGHGVKWRSSVHQAGEYSGLGPTKTLQRFAWAPWPILSAKKKSLVRMRLKYDVSLIGHVDVARTSGSTLFRIDENGGFLLVRR
jgi:hypothetical protein